MKPFIVVMCCLACLAPARAQHKESDPYGIYTVRMSLKDRSGNPSFIIGALQGLIFRMGDDVSVALLKILDDQRLTDPATLSHYLPIVHDAFSHPENITNEVDKTPRVTLFLLNYLQQNVKDASAQTQIQATIDYVKKQAAQPAPSSNPHP